ncbi:MAG: hypothetical protein QOK04_1046 [Solirubrobacteraceae bacterium]|jgi:hypothetical protein|nr:hypothetical protein [Solirubrobacteraceae bacterium]
MSRFVITAKLKRGAQSKVEAILRQGPPFDLTDTSLERHEVFLAKDELVFLFEGPDARHEAMRLLQRPDALGPASRLAAHLRGRPRLPEEVFSWERQEQIDGLSFAPQPGPGDSEGGLDPGT